MFEDRGDERGLTLARKGLLAGRHLVEHRAEGEDVAARVGLLALELFGRHVLECAKDRAALGQRRAQRSLGRQARETGGPGGSVAEPQFGEAEVQELDARLGQHDVGGLQVSVNDSLPMRLVEGIGDLGGKAQKLLGWDPAAREAVGKRFSFEKLHDEEGRAVLLAHVEEPADVGMGELRDRLGFALEALTKLGAVR